ncbi:MAG: hypothetical protein KBI01_01725 [Oscillospiraceae bacterium]|nr:hypothetical protein [Oscillospiraceae bacterium]
MRHLIELEELNNYINRTNETIDGNPECVTEPNIDDRYISLDYVSYLLAS